MQTVPGLHFLIPKSQAMALSFYHIFGEQDSKLASCPIYITLTPTSHRPMAKQLIKQILEE